METYCQNPLCENEATKQVPVSVQKPSDQKRALCAACEEVYRWGVQHGRLFKPGLQIDPPPKEKGPERLYRIVYVIDVNAASIPAAAIGTHHLMTDPTSLAPVLHVLDHRGRDTIVDLAAEPSATEVEATLDETQQKARAFILAGGTQCPVCNRQETDFGTVKVDAEYAYQEATCRHCHTKFCAVYRLAGYGLHVNGSMEVHTLAAAPGPTQGPERWVWRQ